MSLLIKPQEMLGVGKAQAYRRARVLPRAALTPSLAVPRHSRIVRSGGGSSRLVASGQSSSGGQAFVSETAQLQAELAALEASINVVQNQAQTAEDSSIKERQAQEAEIASITAELASYKRQQEQQLSKEEAADIKRMLTRVDILQEDAASMTLTLTERKEEIEGLKRQLAEFEEADEPAFAFASMALKEREAEGGVVTLEGPNWGNDWGQTTIPRSMPMIGRSTPQAPAAFSPALAAAPQQPVRGSIFREPSAPGLLLAAGAMGIGRIWTSIKQAFPPEGARWLDLSAVSLVLGAACYAAYSR